MNQIMRVGSGVVIAFYRSFTQQAAHEMREKWHEVFPDVPMVMIPECQIVQNDGEPIWFQFTGDITPTFFAEFQRWWEEVNSGLRQD